jgi:hypothetical protein
MKPVILKQVGGQSCAMYMHMLHNLSEEQIARSKGETVPKEKHNEIHTDQTLSLTRTRNGRTRFLCKMRTGRVIVTTTYGASVSWYVLAAQLILW